MAEETGKSVSTLFEPSLLYIIKRVMVFNPPRARYLVAFMTLHGKMILTFVGFTLVVVLIGSGVGRDLTEACD